ncbi:MAG: hypothetical protein ACRC6X_00115, partial [Culicoidibacterales bacterium]
MTNNVEQSVLSYNQFGDLVSYKDSRGNIVGYMYDALGRRTGMIYPNGKQVSYSYDKADQLLEVVDGMDITRYTYDEVGQLVETILPNGTITRHTYDGARRLTILETTSVEQSGNNEFLGFIKDDAYNEDYKLELKSQTTTEQLENLRNNMREFKDIHS